MAEQYTLFFFTVFLPTCLFILSLLVMNCSNPIASLFSLIGVFFFSVLLFLALRIEFLSLIFLIVYIGAIAILFLFVIMLFNLRRLEKGFLYKNPGYVHYTRNSFPGNKRKKEITDFVSVKAPWYYLRNKFVFTYTTTNQQRFWEYFFLWYYFFFIFFKNPAKDWLCWHFISYSSFDFSLKVLKTKFFELFTTYYSSSNPSDIVIFSNYLYENHFYLLFLSGVILLSAMVCSIVVALTTAEDLN